EWSKLSVVASTRVVPAQPQRVHMTSDCIRECRAFGDRMARVLQEHGLAGAGFAGVRVAILGCHRRNVDQLSCVDRPARPVSIDANRGRLYAEEMPDERRERGHRSAGYTYRNRSDGFLLNLIGALIRN